MVRSVLYSKTPVCSTIYTMNMEGFHQREQSGERTPQEREAHKEMLANIIQETGFTRLPGALDETTIKEWYEQSQQELSNDVDEKLRIGFQLVRAKVYYELGDAEEYFAEMDAAVLLAEGHGYADLAEKIRASME
jgi:hypothetical protein